MQPQQTGRKTIVVRKPGLNFNIDPLATPSNDDIKTSDCLSVDNNADEGQFITPDQIQDSFNEIEKYLVADDDNIFENVDDGSQKHIGDGLS